MKKEILFAIGFMFLISVGSIPSAASVSGESMLLIGNFEQSTISISVPDTLKLPTAVRGYKASENFNISNTGTINASITTSLMAAIDGDEYYEVFDKLIIRHKDGPDSYSASGYKTEISKPNLINDKKTEQFTISLDLTDIGIEDYSEEEKVYIVFTAVPA